MGRRIVVVGVPGVGKTTVVNEAVKILRARGHRAEIAIFGTFMLREAVKSGVRHRDDVRRLPIDFQKKIQSRAAKVISKLSTEFVFVDTHALIRTPSGLWPGLPQYVLDSLQPHLFVIVEASPREVLERRTREEDRKRDLIRSEDVEVEFQMTRDCIATASVLTGAPACIVVNREGKAREAAQRIVKAVGGL